MPTINGTSNADRLFGSPQNDTLSGSTGADVLRGGAGNDVYVVDNASDVVDETNFVVSNTTSVTQVDLGSAAANRAIDLGDISPDGTKIVFSSSARLAGTDVSDAGNDFYVKDLISGTITHVNVRSTGAQATPLTATYRAMFLDNNRVAFSSTDASMMAGVTDTNGSFDIFIKNLTTGELTLVSNAAGSSTTTASSASALASVSLDGSKILFTSLSTNLGPTDTNGFQDLYMKDVNTGVVTLVSQLSTGVQADNESTRTGFTGRVLAKFVGGDNTKVLFSSKATNFVTPDNNNTGANTGNILGNDLFIKDLVTGTITRVNTGSAGQQANYNIKIGDVNNDGTKVLFVTQASNLIDPLNSTVNTVAQLYVKDLVSGTVTLISTPNGSTLADLESYNPIFTADGTRVIFRTSATNLGAGSTAGSDMLMYDLNTNQLIQLNTTSAGVASDGNTPNSAALRTILSPDGSRMYFIDQANNISGTSEAFLDIFYRDLFQVTSGDAGGTDTVQSSIDYSLGSNIENLTLTGSGNINGTGNSANNTITGNSGNNTITGGDGVDTLTGGGGSDTFVFSNTSHSNNANPDVVTDFVAGTDKINVTGMSGSAIQYGGTTSGANRLWSAQSGGNTDVMIDTTGDGVADTTIRLTGTINLAASDFIGVVTNSAPVANPVMVSGSEDALTITGNASATDPDSNPLTYSISGGTPTGVTLNSNGSFSYTPQAADQALDDGESRQVSFQYIANDGSASSNAATITITINGANDAPVATDVSVSGSEDAASIDGSVSATDVDVEALMYSVSGATPAGLTFSSDGTFSYAQQSSDQVLDVGESRQVSFQYVASDGTAVSNAQTVTITINGANDVPVATDVSVSGSEDDTTIDGIVSATDVDVEPLTYAVSGATPSGLVFNSDGTFSYTPQTADQALDSGETRDVTFQYVANDGTVDSAAQTVTITINGVKDAPVATDVAVSGSEDDASISGNVSATDVDVEPLTYAVSGATPTGLTFNSDGSFGYIPQAIDQALNVGQSRDVTFQYVANDGTLGSAAQTVTITINGTDDATTFTGDFAATVGEGGNPSNAPISFNGQITINDVDTTGLEMVANSSTGLYGSFAIDPQGQWSYQIDPALLIVQQLTASDTVQDSFMVQSSNGVMQQITLTIKGSNIFIDQADLNQYSGGSQDDIIYGYSGKDTLNGQQGNDSLYGGADQDTLIGGEGNDYLDGGTHIDTLIGGAGNDTYVVNTTLDKITELDNEGIDTVLSSDSYQLSANIENLTLTAGGLTGNGNNLINTMNAHALGSTLNGGGGNDILNGNIGNDNLNGGTGSDLMTGGLGDDVYFVNGVGDQVVELAGEGIDTVYTLVSYALRPNIENVVLMAGGITAFGNVNSNSITASLYGNTLDGGGGDDVLVGRQGNDVLVGGNGKDLMLGAQGDDRYMVNTRGDRVVEFAGEGHDTIESSISWTMEDHVEDLILIGNNDSFAKGNTEANTITGNIGQNRLDGAGGLDRLVGGAGNDSYILARSYQQTEVVEDGNAAGGTLDLVEFSAGIYADQVWFAQAGNDLSVSVIGTQASVLIKDWYSTGMGIEQFTLRDGQVLHANEVQQLVDQMAAFAPPSFGQTELTTEQQNALGGVIQSTWGLPV